jgi:hypothetical protein
MNPESKARILDAIDQAIDHCKNVAAATDDAAERGRLQALQRSLTYQRLDVGGAKVNYPNDSEFHQQAWMEAPISYTKSPENPVESLLTAYVPRFTDAASVERFSDLVSRFIDSERI